MQRQPSSRRPVFVSRPGLAVSPIFAKARLAPHHVAAAASTGESGELRTQERANLSVSSNSRCSLLANSATNTSSSSFTAKAFCSLSSNVCATRNCTATSSKSSRRRGQEEEAHHWSTGKPRAPQPTAARALSEQPAASPEVVSSVPVGLRARHAPPPLSAPPPAERCGGGPKPAPASPTSPHAGGKHEGGAPCGVGHSRRRSRRVRPSWRPLRSDTRLHKKETLESDAWWCVCGSDDSGHGVSSQARA